MSPAVQRPGNQTIYRDERRMKTVHRRRGIRIETCYRADENRLRHPGG